MKKLFVIITVLAVLAVFAGCKLEETLERVEDRIENKLEGGKSASEATLSQAEAEEIALKDAGFTREQAQRLYTLYESDDGVPQYDVTFYVGETEYEYEIHADSGKILSFDRESIYD